MKLKSVLATLILTALLLLAGNSFGQESTEKKSEAGITHLTSANYKAETLKGVVLVDFWASWCMPCRRMNPILKDLSVEMGDSVKVCKMDVDNFKQFAANKRVRLLPTFVIYKDGKEVDRIEGGLPKADLAGRIRKAHEEK